MKYTIQAVYGEKIPFTTAENLDYLLKFLKPQTLYIKFIKIFFYHLYGKQTRSKHPFEKLIK